MSRGTFDYIQHKFPEIIYKIDSVIENNNIPNEFGHTDNFPPEIIEKFKNIRKLVRNTQEIVHTLDYLLDGDIGIDSFEKEYQKVMERIKKRQRNLPLFFICYKRNI